MNQGSCTWNEEILVPLQFPIMKETLIFKVYDEDLVNDEIIGALEFPIKEFIDGKYNNRLFWVNLHGAPMDVSGKFTDYMNENPKLASFWRGRILVQVESSAAEVEHPLYTVRRCPDDHISEAIEFASRMRKYQYQLYVGSGLALP